MVFIMRVHMFVFFCLMIMLVFMYFSQVKPKPESHKSTR